MNSEIERKFFIKEIPDLSHITPIKYERYFIEYDGSKEVRISRIDNIFIYEEKIRISPLERQRNSKQITEDEFNNLKTRSTRVIIRDKYVLSSDPKISLQIYHGDYEGLIRAEVEFSSLEEAKAFIPLSWMGQEMTQLPIANDATLTIMSLEDFKRYL